APPALALRRADIERAPEPTSPLFRVVRGTLRFPAVRSSNLTPPAVAGDPLLVSLAPSSGPAIPPAPLAVVLFSGGLDSTTTLHLALRDGFRVHALSFDYGQIHASELEAARTIAARARAAGSAVASHRVVSLDLASFGGSALTDRSIPVPKLRNAAQMSVGIPTTYVPARNTVFLAHALALAESVGARDLFLGVNVLDSSGY